MHMLEKHNGDDTLFTQTRIGRSGQAFEVFKLRTLQDDDVTPIDNRAAFLRRSGMDELIQYKNVHNRDMNVVGGWRPLTPLEYEQSFDLVPGHVVDRFKAVVVPTRPGIVTSFAVETHLGKIDDGDMALERMEMGLKYAQDASYEYDRELFLNASLYGLMNKMRRGDIRPRRAA